MKKLKLMALEFGASELFTREQLKTITGGSGGAQCGTVQNCSTDSCTVACAGGGTATGTCGLSNHGTNCGCASGGCQSN